MKSSYYIFSLCNISPIFIYFQKIQMWKHWQQYKNYDISIWKETNLTIELSTSDDIFIIEVNVKMGKRKELSDFERGGIIGARRADDVSLKRWLV